MHKVLSTALVTKPRCAVVNGVRAAGAENSVGMILTVFAARTSSLLTFSSERVNNPFAGFSANFALDFNSWENPPMQNALPKPAGLREQNRQHTLQRIAEVGIELFLAKGYEATTLDEIAAAAGISRRTFFYYFKSKEDILLTHLEGYADALRASVLKNASA